MTSILKLARNSLPQWVRASSSFRNIRYEYNTSSSQDRYRALFQEQRYFTKRTTDFSKRREVSRLFLATTIASLFSLAIPQVHAKSHDETTKVTLLNTYEFLQETPKQDKTYIVFVRHGESEVNALKRVGGSSQLADLNLTEKGKEDARKLGNALAHFKDRIGAVYTSPLLRAQQTASIALTAMRYSGKIPLETDERIKEKFFGKEIDGQPEEIYKKFATIEKEETRQMNFWQKWTYTVVSDAESFEKIYVRVKKFMLEAAAKHQGETILAFGHKVSSIKIPIMGALAESGIEVDYRDPLFNEPKNGATAIFEVDVLHQKINLVAIDGFSMSFLSAQ
jgi:broad specificity phosphatase PhoE